MTNEEKIRQMTTKELAELIACGSTVFSCKDCKYNHRIGTCKMEDCKKAIIEWLGAEAERDWYLIRRERLSEIKRNEQDWRRADGQSR